VTCDLFFYEAFDEETDAIRRHMPETVSAEFTWKTIQEAAHDTPPAPVISIRTQSVIPPGWGGKLDALLTRSTGYDHVSRYRETHAPTLACGYLPLYCNRAVAEHAMLLWMALLRKLPRQLGQFGTFHRDGITGSECEGKTLVVAGVGNIGYQVARIGSGLGMRVLGVDPVRKHGNIEYLGLYEALREADVLVCAMNLTADNARLFNAKRLQRLKPGAILVNIARGELLETEALPRLLDEGRLGGIALDVYDREPELAVALREKRSSTDAAVQAVLDLARRDNVICTPHNAFNTAESVDRKAAQSVQQAEAFFTQGSFLWPVP
jgi:D-lactate dehydrogenase